jgi:hypothetical protein
VAAVRNPVIDWPSIEARSPTSSIRCIRVPRAWHWLCRRRIGLTSPSPATRLPPRYPDSGAGARSPPPRGDQDGQSGVGEQVGEPVISLGHTPETRVEDGDRVRAVAVQVVDPARGGAARTTRRGVTPTEVSARCRNEVIEPGRCRKAGKRNLPVNRRLSFGQFVSRGPMRYR